MFAKPVPSCSSQTSFPLENGWFVPLGIIESWYIALKHVRFVNVLKVWCKFPCVHKSATKNIDVVWKGAVGVSLNWAWNGSVWCERWAHHMPHSLYHVYFHIKPSNEAEGSGVNPNCHWSFVITSGTERVRTHKRVATPNSQTFKLSMKSCVNDQNVWFCGVGLNFLFESLMGKWYWNR